MKPKTTYSLLMYLFQLGAKKLQPFLFTTLTALSGILG
jgi:hypothetical protein